jgi:hypothetical protein
VSTRRPTTPSAHVGVLGPGQRGRGRVAEPEPVGARGAGRAAIWLVAQEECACVAALVLNEIYSRMRGQLPALEAAADELRLSAAGRHAGLSRPFLLSAAVKLMASGVAGVAAVSCNMQQASAGKAPKSPKNGHSGSRVAPLQAWQCNMPQLSTGGLTQYSVSCLGHGVNRPLRKSEPTIS